MKLLKILVISSILLIGNTLFAQSFDYEKNWKQIKELEKKGLFAQALEKTSLVFSQAQKEGNSVQLVKSLVYKTNFRQNYEEDAMKKAIQELREMLLQVGGIEKAMLSIALSDVYQQYYQRNQWEIRERIHVAGKLPVEIEAWSQENFAAQIEELIIQALSFEEDLQLTAAENWKEVFQKDANSFDTFPSLYDFVAWSAIDFYSATEFVNAAMEDLVLLNHPMLFQDASQFVAVRMNEKESKSYKAKALQLYQKLIFLHQGNKTTTALLYSESQRISFLQTHGQIDDKESLLLQTLNQLFDQYQGQAGSEYLAEKLLNHYMKNTKSETDLRKAEEICLTMIKHERNTKFFKETLKTLYDKDLNIDLEGVLLPNQNNFSTIEFKNLNHIWFRVVQVSRDEEIKSSRNNNDHISSYIGKPIIAEFNYLVADKEYLSLKKALFEMPQLSVGHYAIIASNSADFDMDKDELRMGMFWVTRLQLISRGNEGQFLVVDRENGKPIDKATIKVFSSQWEYSTRSKVIKLEEILSTSKDGSFQYMNAKGKQIHFELSKGQDEWTSTKIYVREHRQNNKAYEKHLFFTDRAIYRPGQKVYFKGIFTSQKENKIAPLPNLSKEIKLYSANGKVLQTLELSSNDYGSVAGSFVLPLSGLTGNMRISDGKGSVSFKMENYKRPKFEVKLDQPKQEYQLFDQVNIIGHASYFAGVGLQNAKVKYRVSRSVYMPWRWGFWPQIDDIDIAAGESMTDENGNFEVSFLAVGPMNKEFMPWFIYTVTAEVTDETGETHISTTNIRLGKESILISSNMPEIIDLEHPKDVEVKAETPNGQKINSEIQFKLEKLIQENQLSQIVKTDADTLLISPEKLKKEFKDYIFQKEAPELPIEAIVFEMTLNTEVDSIISKSIFKSLPVGTYKMTLSTSDKNGMIIKDTAIFKIFSSQKNLLPAQEEFFNHLSEHQLKVKDTLHFSFGSSIKNVKYYYQLNSGNKMISSSWIKTAKGMNHMSIPILEEYRGGLSLQLFFIDKNQWYSVNKRVHIPFDNKELNISLLTLRNPMEPGVKEHWKLKIENMDGEKVDAEVLAAMYDASLDVFVPNNWHFWPYHAKGNPYNWSAINTYLSKSSNKHYGSAYPSLLKPINLSYDWSFANSIKMYSSMTRGAGAMPDMVTYAVAEDVDASPSSEKMETVNELVSEQPEKLKEEPKPLSPRKNLQETAFFYPKLLSDMTGNVSLNFVSPEALSRWKLMVMAITKEMDIGHFSQEVVTQKEVMVMPNLPRFLRGGDQISISTKILNLLEEPQKISATLEILNAATKEPLNLFIDGENHIQALDISAKGQGEVTWNLSLPEKVGAVIVRILARGDAHTDGEEHVLPVLSQLHFLTDTYPFSLSSQSSLIGEDLQLRETEKTHHDELTLEVTTNPLWYVVQALPNYQMPQKPNALSWFNYYFIHAMAKDIVNKNPEIQEVFKQWQMLSPEELESELFQNQELKTVMIEETPWIFNAENQSQRKKDIARLFDENNLNYHLESALNKLKDLQKSNGGFSWIDGMKTSPYISAQIADGLGQLIESDILDLQVNYIARNMVKSLVKYMDEEIERAYQKAIKNKKNNSYGASRLISSRAYFIDTYPLKSSQNAYDYFLNGMKEKKFQKSLQEKAKLARVLWYVGQTEEAYELLLAIKDIALKDENGGIYWRGFQRYESVRRQAEMIELFELTSSDTKWTEGMKLWLLQQKRANDWGDNMATVQACYAMLNGTDALSESPRVYLTINGKEQLIDGNAGTGYFKMTWKGNEIPKALEGFKIRKEGKGIIFGAFYDQYFEKMSEIDAHEGGVNIKKQVFVAQTTDDKNELLVLAEGSKINLGDRVLVRLIISNDQAMDFVHLRDYLPAGFENQNPLSGYHWKGHFTYYQAPGDVATDYYISHLPKGSFVIEYELNATISGQLNLGPAEIQSLYAPEYGGHSEGGMIEVMK